MEEAKGIFRPDSPVRETVIELFGEENVDFIEEDGGNLFRKVVIFFPSLTLENEEGQKHVIDTGMFVRIGFTGGTSRSSSREVSLEGMRMTITYPEAVQAYTHSHCKNCVGTWNSFCTGVTMGELINRWRHTGDDSSAIILLNTLHTYLNDESLKGGPFQRMNRVYELSNSNSYDSMMSSRDIRTIARNVFRFKIENGTLVPAEINLAVEGHNIPDHYFVKYFSPSLNQAITEKYFDCEEEALGTTGSSFLNLNRSFVFRGERLWVKLVPPSPIADLQEGSNILASSATRAILDSCESALQGNLSNLASSIVAVTQNQLGR